MIEAKYPYDLRTIGLLKVLYVKGKQPKKGFTKYAYEHSIELRVDCKDYPVRGRNLQLGRRMSRLINEGYVLRNKDEEYSISYDGVCVVKDYQIKVYPELMKNVEIERFIRNMRHRDWNLIMTVPDHPRYGG